MVDCGVMIKNDRQYLEELNTKMRKIYDSIGRVFCPALQKIVVFNAKGFHHLHYLPNGKPRTAVEQMYKLRLIPLATAVVRNSSNVLEERCKIVRLVRRRHSKLVVAKQYALIATVGRKPITVRVVVMEFNNSQNPIFWSIMINKKTIE